MQSLLIRLFRSDLGSSPTEHVVMVAGVAAGTLVFAHEIHALVGPLVAQAGAFFPH